jgi:hypothetical protein
MLRRPSMAPDERRYRAEEALTLGAQTPTIVGVSRSRTLRVAGRKMNMSSEYVLPHSASADQKRAERLEIAQRLYKALVRQDPQPSDYSVRQQRSGRGSPRSAA